MTIERLEKMAVLHADEGMILTNGETASTTVYLGKSDSADNWQEVEEYAEGATADINRVESIETALAEQAEINEMQDETIVEIFESLLS